ncbi:MAG: protein jag [Chloroflexi bacterium]|nr:protein jag [Chloroflexota bacterium]
MATRQFTGKTVAEATDLALGTLGLKREEVEIVVVNPGRAGILGFGGEPAVISVTPLAGAAPVRETTRREVEPPAERRRAQETAAVEKELEEAEEEEFEEKGLEAEEEGAEAPEEEAEETGEEEEEAFEEAEEEEPEKEEEGEEVVEAFAVEEEAAPAAARERREEGQPRAADPEAEQLATEILDFFLATMGVKATTYVREDPPDGAIAFEIEGEDAGLLIGRRGETLQALQFLVNLIVNKQLDRQAYITVDVEGYKERRQEALRSLAQRTASKVVGTGRPVQLQPMPASERRIIHLTLADHPEVRTESKGDGDQRRVVVLPRH